MYEPVFSAALSSPMGACVTFHCPMRSSRSTARSGSIRAASGSTTSRRPWAVDASSSAGESRSRAISRATSTSRCAGEDMHLRYPEGIRSTGDADLSVRGNLGATTLGGVVRVKQATWTPGWTHGRHSRIRIGPAGITPNGRRHRRRRQFRFDLEVIVPSTLRVENNLARLVASADLQLRGTYDRPVLFGRARSTVAK